MRSLRDLLPCWMWWGTATLNVLQCPGFPTLKCYLFMQMVVAAACSIFAISWLVFSCAINKCPEPLSEMATLLSLSSRKVYLAAGFSRPKCGINTLRIICPLVLMKYLYFSMQVLTDWMTFPMCKGLVPCTEMCQLHSCQHIWEDLSRSLLAGLESFNKALKSCRYRTPT